MATVTPQAHQSSAASPDDLETGPAEGPKVNLSSAESQTDSWGLTSPSEDRRQLSDNQPNPTMQGTHLTSNIQESNIQESNIQESNIQESNIQESNIQESNIQESSVQESGTDRQASGPASEQPEEDHAVGYPPMMNVFMFLGFSALTMVLWNQGYWYLSVLCWLPMAHLGHSVLLAFHEAVHFTLSKKAWLNDFRGFVIGSSVGVPLSVYRHLHKYHHSNLSSPQDAELWPYNDPSQPRWFRRLSAAVELTLGFFYTPVIFLRGVLIDKKMSPALRRRIAIEYVLVIAVWVVLLSLVHMGGWWIQFLVGYLIPSMLAANLQTMRKFTEHMGLVGKTPLTLTRSVVDRTWTGRWIAASMLNVCYHGTHHRYGKLAYYDLPEATNKAYRTEAQPIPLYTSYWSAFWAMVPTLADPKCGANWLRETPNPASPRPEPAKPR